LLKNGVFLEIPLTPLAMEARAIMSFLQEDVLAIMKIMYFVKKGKKYG
jgi:hypothetical protein